MSSLLSSLLRPERQAAHESPPRSAGACPACGGIECLERPRFFAGQLLTEAELNSNQQYVLAKNRLHNRYLHGPGVVAGLQVECDDCEGWVTVNPGYAIDPCGNDVVVCDQQRIDIRMLIDRCRQTGARRRADCDPVRPRGSDDDCRGVEEHWCLTIAYEEREAAAATALHRAAASARACSCGCHNGNGNGNGHDRMNENVRGYANGKGHGGSSGCGCGCEGGAGTTVTRSPTTTRVAACEPTRIVEGFRFGLAESSVSGCTNLQDVIDGTLLWRIWRRFLTYWSFMQRRIPSSSVQTVWQTIFTNDAAGSPRELYEAYCYLRQALYDLDAQNEFPVRCMVKEQLDAIKLAPPGDGDGDGGEGYAQRAREAIQQLLTIAVQHFVDDVCTMLLPPLPPDPLDDRLILACITMRDGKIVQICNHSCRRHAGAFPTVAYWLSIVPVVQLVGYFVDVLCCLDLANPRGRYRGLFGHLDSVDPDYARREAVYANDFAGPRAFAKNLRTARDSVSARNVVASPEAVLENVERILRGHEER